MTSRFLTILSALLVLGTFSIPADAQIKFRRANAPDFVLKGLDQIKAGNVELAVKTWFAGSSLDGDKTAQAQFVQQFKSLSERNGKLKKVELVDVLSISPSYRHCYYVLIFEKGVVTAEFACFQGTDRWTCTNILTSLNPADIFPNFPYLIED